MAIFHTIPDGDLALVNGDLAFVDGSEYTRQLIQCRFRMFLGEWFLDVREGVPYYQEILVKNPNREVVQSVFRDVLKNTPGVQEIDTFEVVLDRETRALRFNFVCQTDDGAISVSPNDSAFVVRF